MRSKFRFWKKSFKNHLFHLHTHFCLKEWTKKMILKSIQILSLRNSIQPKREKLLMLCNRKTLCKQSSSTTITFHQLVSKKKKFVKKRLIIVNPHKKDSFLVLTTIRVIKFSQLLKMGRVKRLIQDPNGDSNKQL